MVIRRIELSGQTYNDWFVIRFSHITESRSAYWLCRCVCGIEKPVSAAHLKAGRSKSCGCVADKRLGEALTTHGKSNTYEYSVWLHMKQRCGYVKGEDYHNYGGRGITVCDRWVNSFERFLEDMGLATDGMTIDRIDNDAGYSPENCRWASKAEQMRNHRRNRWFTHDGKTMVLMDWARHLGLTQQALQGRLKRWSVEKSLSTPAMVKYRR